MAAAPKYSGKIVADLANNVKVHTEPIDALGEELLTKWKTWSDPFPQNEFFPKPTDPWAVDWLFLLAVLNFCLWRHELLSPWIIEGHVGYYGLCAAINRAMKNGVDITNPQFFVTLTDHQLDDLFRSDNEVLLQLLKRRVKVLHEVGHILNTKYNSTFVTCIEACDHSAMKLLKIITTNFPCFRDEASYEGNKISFHSRAQILIGDLWSCFRNEGYGYFTDLDQLTVAIDVRMPQVLVYYNVVEYTPSLRFALETNILLENGSEMEVEIRGCTLHAAELIRKWMIEHTEGDSGMNAVILTHLLWQLRREHKQDIKDKNVLIHKSLSIFY